MDDPTLEKICIYGPILASILQRFSSSSGDVDGLLFGHATQYTTPNLSDETDSAESSRSSLIATISSHFCSGITMSFYDSLGQLEPSKFCRIFQDRSPGASLIGWFCCRRKTPLRTSMREFSVTSSLCKTLPESSPCVFIIFSTFSNQLIHTHEYRAFQFNKNSSSLKPGSLDIINIGPGFRDRYDTFCPISLFPWLSFGSDEERKKVSVSQIKEVNLAQNELDFFAKDFEIDRLSRMLGSNATNYTLELEEMYRKMLLKLEDLTRLVETSSAKVLEQEKHNTKLRTRVAGLE